MANCKKVSFGNEQIALFHINKLKLNSDRNRIPIRTYKCECGAWHLTSRISFEDIRQENDEVRLQAIELVKEIIDLKAEVEFLTGKNAHKAVIALKHDPEISKLKKQLIEANKTISKFVKKQKS